MRYKNFSAYVQRQIDRLLKRFRRFARVYVNDIVIFSKTIEKHVVHLRSVFDMLQHNNIFIKFNKIFLNYSSVTLLDQKMNSFDLFINVEKLKTIIKIQFFKTLRLLKIYLNLIDYLREYVFYYVDVFKALQTRKIELLKSFFVTDNARKTFANRTRIDNFTSLKIEFFRILQSLLSQSLYLIHHDSKRQLFVDLNVSKEFDFDVVIYHVKFIVNWNDKDYSSRKSLKFILFLSRLLISVETRYWSTELKIVEIVWMLKKIKHLIESSTISTIIYIDHEFTLDIVKQISLFTSFTNKLNFRLIRVSNYIQRFNLELRHKSDVQHIIFDAFSRLVNLNIDENKQINDEKEFDALFIIILVEMNEVFRNRFLKNYRKNSAWKKISDFLNAQISFENSVSLSFYRENEFIFRFDDYTIDNHAFESRRFCIFQFFVDEIFDTIHDAINDHVDFRKCYERLIFFYFIRRLFKQFRDYLRHCSNCQIYQTRRHKSYDSMQSILTSSIFFHTLIINFILNLFKFRDDFDIVMFVTCKHTKRVTCVLSKFTWSIAQWEKTLLDRLNIVDWNVLKIIIFDRDRKFMFDL